MKKWSGGKQDGGGDSPAVMPFELRPHDMEELKALAAGREAVHAET